MVSKIHLQPKPSPYRVIVQSEVFGVNIAILPIYAESLMIQVIRPFLNLNLLQQELFDDEQEAKHNAP